MPSFLVPEIQVLIWTIFVFFVLVLLLKKFAWGPLMQALQEREARIAKQISDAQSKLQEAEARAAEYEKRLLVAKTEAAEIIAEGKRDVQKVRDEIMAAAQVEAARERERAKREIGLAKEAAIAEFRDLVVSLTAELAEKVIEREVKADDHRRLIGDYISKIEKLEQSA